MGGSGDLFYRSVAGPRYRPIGMHYAEHNGQLATRAEMVDFQDVDTE